MAQQVRFWLGLLVAAALPSGAMAQSSAPRAYSNPPRLDFSAPQASSAMATPSRDCPGFGTSPGDFKIVGNEISLSLNAEWTRPAVTSIYNPVALTDQGEPQRDALKLRSYNGCLVGPVIEIRPGQTLRTTLNNRLDIDAPAGPPNCPPPLPPGDPDAIHKTPNCFDWINLHTHGWHVSPEGNSDNVFLEIRPGSSFPYEHAVPADHPAGTFWYHSHRHGSTAIQVASGMAGALIVRGNRTVQDKLAGRAGVADIDTILKARNRSAMTEQVMVFEQLSYACFDDKGEILTRDDGRWRCGAKDIGEVRNYDQFGGPGAWDSSGRFTSVNGEVLPRMGAGQTIRAGEIQRWRMIHAGIRDAVNVKIVKVDPLAAQQRLQSTQPGSAPARTQQLLQGLQPRGRAQNVPAIENQLRQLLESPFGLRPDARSQTLREQVTRAICGDDVVQQLEFAVDGLTRTRFQEKDVNFLQPGYRSDTLVAFPDPGLYCVLDASVASDGRPIPVVPGTGQDVTSKPQRLLMSVEVAPGRAIPGGANRYRQHAIRQILETNPQFAGGDEALRQVGVRLGNNDLSDFAFNADLRDPVGTKSVRYEISGLGPPPPPPAPPPPLGFGWDALDGKNFQQFKPDTFPFEATVNTVEDWNLSAAQSHIHHIHVNPFQVQDIVRTADQRSIFEPGGVCATASGQDTGDSAIQQFCDQKGVFRDTIFLRAGLTVKVRTRYERYIGEFVLHCHILDHEDQGMMAGVRIRPPGGGPVNARTAADSDAH
ncbi:MAG: multicopper oxidase domain-containing protein [Tardiphaga sp.]